MPEPRSVTKDAMRNGTLLLVKMPHPNCTTPPPAASAASNCCCIVVGKDQYGNIMGLGGNQSDQVSIVPFPMSRLNKGFWWPKDVSMPWNIGLNLLPLVKSNGQLSSKEA